VGQGPFCGCELMKERLQWVDGSGLKGGRFTLQKGINDSEQPKVVCSICGWDHRFVSVRGEGCIAGPNL
jgi:hypothetical protein